jgi:hypothetical protein
MTVSAAESQTTPIVTGVDIFSFGAADKAPGPGNEESEQATPAPAKEEHPGEASEKEGGSLKAEGGSEKEEESAPPESKPRFKDHAAAEEGYRNLQGQTTKAQQELADARKRLAEIEAQQAAQRDQQSAGERQALIDQAIDEYEIERNEKAMKDIEALDTDDPEHQKKVARIWAACHKDVRKFVAAPVDKDGKPLEVGSRKSEVGSAEEKQIPPEGVESSAADSNARSARTSPKAGGKTADQIREEIDGKVRAAGIDPDDELWVGVALTTPEKDADGKSMSVDQQIEWTINRYNEKRAAMLARVRQEAGLPLGEGGGGPPAEKGGGGNPPAGPIGLGDAIARANDRRRLI